LRYLYRLRSALGEARTLNDIAQQSGDTLMEALSVSASTGIKIVLGDRTWTFGIVDKTAQTRQSRALSWGGRARGKLQLYCTFELNEAQERTLLYETAEQIVHALETRELESELLRSARLVSMGEMAASVAHELHQPLGAISATAEDVYMRLIENIDLSPEDLKEMMQDMLGFVERMAGTVDHLRVFSRDTSKEPGVQFSINDVIRSSLKLIETQLQNHGITLILELSEELPQIDGHPYQIEQVFLNLLSNARDALDEREGVEKRIVVRSLEGDGGVNVEVEDNGAGISEAHLDRLFDPFFTTKEAGQGTGLGLAISYAIVKNHGGEMKCESLQDHGALFWVALPEVR
jgi:signal transduction histidine kinase